MKIYSPDGLLLDVLVREAAVSVWLESDRLLMWIHAESQEIMVAKDMLGLDAIPIFLPTTRSGLVKVIVSQKLIPISGDIICLN